MVNHDCNSGATATFIVLVSMLCASMVELLMVMSCTWSSPLTRTLLKQFPASVITSPRLPPILRLSSLSLRALIKPPQQHLQMTSQLCTAANAIQVLSNRLSPPFSVLSCITDPPPQLLSHPGKSSCSAVGSSFDGPPTLQTVIALGRQTPLDEKVRGCDGHGVRVILQVFLSGDFENQ